MSDWTMLTKQQLENDAEDRAGDSSAMDHILTGLALYARIAELETTLATVRAMLRLSEEGEYRLHDTTMNFATWNLQHEDNLRARSEEG